MIERDAASVVVRVQVFGEFRVERRTETGLWEPVPASDWGKGTTSRQALKYLLSRGRMALRQDMVDALWEQSEPVLAEDYLNKAIIKLRQAIHSEQHGNLLQTLYNRTTYKLADQAHIWVDAEACEQALTEAERVGLTTSEGMRLLEQAVEYFTEGPLLIGEGGRWSHSWRGRLETARDRCLLWLIDGYTHRQDWRKAEAIAEQILQDDPIDENTLGRLMYILHMQGLTSQALQRYRDTKAFCQRQQMPFPSVLDALAQEFKDNISTNETYTLLKSPSPSNEVPILNRRSFLFLPNILSTSLVDSFYSNVFHHTSALLSTSPKTLQDFDDYTIRLWKQRNTSEATASVLYQYSVQHLDRVKGFLDFSLLPSERKRVCDIISRTALLSGALLYDMGYYSHARQAMQTAIQAAIEAHNQTLQAITWTWMSFTWTYTPSTSLSLPCILEAHALHPHISNKRTKAWMSAVKAEIHAQLQQREECLSALQQAEFDFDDQPEETHYLFGFDAVLLDGYRGVCFQQFYQEQVPGTFVYLQEAREALQRALLSGTTERRTCYYLGDLALAEARQKNIELACTYASDIIRRMGKIESRSITRRLITICQLLQPHGDSASVKNLQEQVSSFLLNRGQSSH